MLSFSGGWRFRKLLSRRIRNLPPFNQRGTQRIFHFPMRVEKKEGVVSFFLTRGPSKKMNSSIFFYSILKKDSPEKGKKNPL